MIKLSSGVARISQCEKIILPQVKTVTETWHLRHWFEPLTLSLRHLLTSSRIIWTANIRRVLSALVFVCLVGPVVGAVRADAPEMLSPTKLARLEATALQLFDDAQHGDWQVAEQHLREIGMVAEPVITRLNTTNTPLIKALVRSARALRDHDRTGAQHGANKILEWTARADAAAHPDVPPQVGRLEYLAREIQIETGGGDSEKLARRVLETRSCWDRLGPLLETKGDTATLREGEAVIHQLELAQTPDALAQTQAPLSKLIEHVRKTFDPVRR